MGKFQSTPPVWGATVAEAEVVVEDNKFQSTPPVWGATYPSPGGGYILNISIHTPRVGGGRPVPAWRRRG